MAENQSVIYYARTLITPQQWRAGFVGANNTPFYFDCCKCGAHEPKIAGFYDSKPDGKDISSILIIRPEHGRFPVKLALYCEKCWKEEEDARQTKSTA